MNSRAAGFLVSLAVAVTAATGVVAVVLEFRGVDKDAVDVAWVAMLQGSALVWATVGAMLVTKRPANRLGLLLLVGGLGLNIGAAADRYAFFASADLPYAVLVAALAGWMWLPAALVVMFLIPLTFPTGRLPPGRWRWVAWFGAAGATVAVVAMIITPLRYPDVFAARDWEAPVWVRAEQVIEAAFTAMLLAGILAWVSLVLRFARSRGEERQQHKWLVFAAGLTTAHLVIFNLVLDEALWLEVATGFVVMPSIAVAIAIAVTRYRLYEIDRLVSQTISYALLTVVLVGLYVAGVLGIGSIVRSASGGAGGDLVVAASTLAVAAAFGPVRRRIQALVDRRFNRSRYDAQRTVEAFAHGLRDEVDLDSLRTELASVAASTLRPTSASVWLAAPASGRDGSRPRVAGG